MTAQRIGLVLRSVALALALAGTLGSCAGTSVGVSYGIYGTRGWYDPYYGRPGGWRPIGPPMRPPIVRPPPVVRPPPNVRPPPAVRPPQPTLPLRPRPMPR